MILGRFRLLIVLVSFVTVVLLLVFFGFGSEPIGTLSAKRLGTGTNLLDDVANSTLGFGKIYAINLPSRTDRRDALTLMAAVTGLELEFIPGWTGDEVNEKALPPPATHATERSGNIGSWRSHLSALSAVVENNLESALIIEDDIDWDLNITQQMIDYAATTRALTQPLYLSSSSYADPSFENPTEYEGQPPDLDFDNLPRTTTPKHSPYGDNWDVLWLGHCGAMAPNVDLSDETLRSQSRALPRGRVVHYNDETVPERHHLAVFEQEFDPRQMFPDHTRVTHHTLDLFCTFAYAVSQRGARRILYETGLRKFDKPFDLMLREICVGVGDRPRTATCLTVDPGIFHTFRGFKKSALSDISEDESDEMENAFSPNIRYSVRLNLPNLLSEMTPVYDQYPDKE